MELEEAIKNLKEIIDLMDLEDKNCTAILDNIDLKSLKVVLQNLEKRLLIENKLVEIGTPQVYSIEDIRNALIRSDD